MGVLTPYSEKVGLGWIAAGVFLAAAPPAPGPAVSRAPECLRTARAPGGDLAVRVRRGVNLSYASPVTVTGWHTESACRQLSAAARVRFARAAGDQRGLARVRLATTLSYAWSYDHRHTLQRIQPGLELSGSLAALPQSRCFLALGFAGWGLRLESTLDLAARADSPGWLASVEYQF